MLIFSHKEEHRPISIDLPWIKVYNKQQSYFETQDTTRIFFYFEVDLIAVAMSGTPSFVTLITVKSQEKNLFFMMHTRTGNFSFRENMWIVCCDMLWT